MKATRNFWPLGIVLAFVLFIGGTAGLIVLASTQKTDLVSENYYEQEIQYQDRIESLARTKELEGRASVAYDSGRQRITLSLPAEHIRAKATGQIQLYRPSATSLDRRIPLAADTNGIQVLDVSGLPKGLWKLRLAWNAAELDYFLDETIVIGAK
jgi:nitrogen fixation protein FixH